MSFTADTRRLRLAHPDCTLSIGVGGRRYRGGRAYVAITVDDTGRVKDALTLRGFTTFARSAPLPALVGLRRNVLVGERSIDGLTTAQRDAARQAAEFVKTSQTARAKEGV